MTCHLSTALSHDVLRGPWRARRVKPRPLNSAPARPKSWARARNFVDAGVLSSAGVSSWRSGAQGCACWDGLVEWLKHGDYDEQCVVGGGSEERGGGRGASVAAAATASGAKGGADRGWESCGIRLGGIRLGAVLAVSSMHVCVFAVQIELPTLINTRGYTE